MTPEDWEKLENIGGRVGFPVERMEALRRRLGDPPQRPGRPLTLVIGRPEWGNHQALARWLDLDAEELREAVANPLVLGKEAEKVRPNLSAWTTRKSGKPGTGHLIVALPAAKLGAALLAQLAFLGYLDQLLLLTRVSQALPMPDRELVAALAPLAATARVLVVAIPGEEVSAGEAVEVFSYLRSQMEQAGFAGRFLGSGLWYVDGKVRAGSLADPGQLLGVPPADLARGREAMADVAVATMFSELRARAAESAAAPVAAIPEDEQERLGRELLDYLSDLGKEVERHKNGQVADTSSLQRYVRSAIGSWGAHVGVEGHWLRYLERLRPDFPADFLQEAEAATELLSYQPGNDDPTAVTDSAPASMAGRIAKRGCVAFVFGVGAYLGSNELLAAGAGAPLAANILVNVGALVGAFLGYGAAGYFFPAPRAIREATLGKTEALRAATICGWHAFQRRLLLFFDSRIRVKPVSPLEELNRITQRLSLQASSEEIHQ